MRRLLSTILTLTLMMQFFIIPAYAKPDWPADTGILAEGGIVIDMDSGTVLFGQNIRVGYYPASITKLLTALVVLEHASLDEEVAFSHDAVYNIEEGSGNYFGLDEGDKWPVEDCLYALILRSSNQASNALAEHVGGTRDGFVDMMNETIERLGCTGSRFKNPSGLNDPEQVVTPYDMALIAKAAFSNEKLLEIASSKRHKFPPTVNTPEEISATIEHKLLKESEEVYFPDAIAGKTGYTSLAGNTLVTLAERDGRRVIAVVLKGSQPQYYIDSRNLLEFGLSKFQNIKIADMETSYTTGENAVEIGGQSYQPSELEIDPLAVITLPSDAEYGDAEKSLVTELPEDHPVGAVALLKYTYNERSIGQAYLLLKNAEVLANAGQTGIEETSQGETAPESQPADQPEDGKGKFSMPSLPVPVLILIVVLILAGGGIGYIVYQRRKEEKERALRRQKRRQRIIDSGCSEEEFDRMVAERMNRKKDTDGK
ncbi:peptidase S11 [Clostridium sp. chh4-2]|uniref:D-alanyl-D-alanine carboxypeptidase family protein n=1 Tax=Clostridium sp. chh4-2 TaxID=2067550 RepID=UPI000CCF9838|nr:D-alanyl-D-alanine carboxypeptidase family protein [Clostridium sp. chh4-2]PNV59421.1 peptidase S11 [Clostridium sp. chh4-2]